METTTPVGIIMPYNSGDNGYFEQTYSDMERALINIRMLLQTARGERPMMPTYGSELREILFDPNTEEITNQLFKSAVEEACQMWMPEADIINVTPERNLDEYPNQVVLKITFSLVTIPDSIQTLELEVSA